MSSIHAWILATRPKTLPAGAAPVIAGLVAAYTVSREINLITALITLLCALILQIVSNLANDYFDHKSGIDNDERLGPTRVTQSGLIDPNKVRNAIIALTIIVVLTGIRLMILGGPPIIIIGILSVIFACAYSAGPFPLSHYGLGEIFAFIFFGPIPVLGTAYLQGVMPETITILWGCYLGFMAAALMSINNYRDQNTDKANGKFTISVFFGPKISRFIPSLFILLGSIVLVYIALNLYPLIWVTVVINTLFSGYIFRYTTEINGPILNNQLANTGKFLFLNTLLISGIILWN